MSKRKRFSFLFLIPGLMLSVFGYWGMFTKPGSKRYEEMDGMIPFFALVAGIILLIVFIIVLFIGMVKKNNPTRL